ncbi:methyltransferase type 11 [Alkalispirochaeta sphaeroplastigenens]|uniref:Methyltransferase type 11 n=1 Tax=Alkalispirochaeta sphaeroplastigenens TaxID=1187066 RepID=A0A2S4JL44_9SPIO|nr:class I SAM-dependent methyltransferase [Alkalispirochaeta sphaeroplastigenens]POR00259.1 methyltransferase type 11 [Alkalispirochaeta sphaeroplastigenens]
MQTYGKVFSGVYNTMWAGFAERLGPLVHRFYASTLVGRENEHILDLCCGTGHLAVYLLRQGYRVVGLDLSEHMLRYARENAASYVNSGQGLFLQDDATRFSLDERFGLVVSTFDSLNHLEDMQALRHCFERVHAVCDGYFVFDLNTRGGLLRSNNVHIDDSDREFFLVNRGVFDTQTDTALSRISGFVRTGDEYYERFEETIRSTAFELRVFVIATVAGRDAPDREGKR